MDNPYWTERFSQSAARIQASTIRELLKLTQRPGILSFAGGLPDPGLFPKEEAAQKALEILRDLGEKALQYSPTEGYLPLRAWVAERLGVDVEEVLVTTGSQQGLDLIGKIFLDEGSPVLVEAPSYMGALQAFRAYGPRFVTVPTDEEGMDLEALEETLKRVRPRFIYALPTFQNPSSALMPLGKRERLVELAYAHGVPLVEDDAYAELYFEAPHPLPAFPVPGVWPCPLPGKLLQDPGPRPPGGLRGGAETGPRQVGPGQTGGGPAHPGLQPDAGPRPAPRGPRGPHPGSLPGQGLGHGGSA